MKTQPKSFDHYPLRSELIRSLNDLGFRQPTPIQQQTLDTLLYQDLDLFGAAPTGTGKTLAFGIPLLQKLDLQQKGIQGLVLCPTRELASQVAEELEKISQNLGIEIVLLQGGGDAKKQSASLSLGGSVGVGTPGRILDLLKKGTLRLNQLKVLILDEADRMISMGFRREVEQIFKYATESQPIQNWMFSATFGEGIQSWIQSYLKNPIRIGFSDQAEATPSTIHHFMVSVHEDQKPGVVERIIDSTEDFYGLVFCQTKPLADRLTEHLKRHRYPAEGIHGDFEQSERERILKSFRQGEIRILVCTDLASRGIDIVGMNHVILYSLPTEAETYIHRVGRTGRAGSEGTAWSLVNPNQRDLVARIEKKSGIRFRSASIPTDEAIIRARVKGALRNWTRPLNEDDQTRLIQRARSDSEWNAFLNSVTKEELVDRFLRERIEIRALSESMHDQPRKREGTTRKERRKEFLKRTQKRQGLKR